MQQELIALAEALGRREGQPETSFGALHALADAIVGAKLFTLMAFDSSSQEGSRIYTNMPDAYPLFGNKPLPEGAWTEKVIGAQEIFVANDIDAIAEVFADHEKIQSLGCGCVINVPVVTAGNLLGTINCLDRAGTYTPEKVADASSLILPGAACFLLYKTISAMGDT